MVCAQASTFFDTQNPEIQLGTRVNTNQTASTSEVIFVLIGHHSTDVAYLPSLLRTDHKRGII